ncbi:MAG: cytochrome c biogenesis protein CcdA [Candidatus Pacearchaeota archaeon]
MKIGFLFKKEFTLLLFSLVFFCLVPFVLSQENVTQQKIYFFYGEGCPHCENVFRSGILNKVSQMDNTEVFIYEVYFNQTNRKLYLDFVKKLEIPSNQRGVPLVIVEYCNIGYSYFIGDKPIIENLEEAVKTCKPFKKISSSASSDNPSASKLTIGSIIIAALIDSINPCAFGVLIFLMATMLSMASSKRALRYGLVYTFIIFLVYFSAGLGIIKVIQSFHDIINWFVLFAAIFVFIGGLIEIKDFFWYGKGISLKIPTSVKPTLERITQKGTLPAVILLGIIVALVELPCTGGIYLAILSLMSVNKTFGIPYLLLYNLIFILPLLVIVFLVYFGTKTEKISKWVEGEKRWMRLAAGIIMILLALYLFNSVYYIFS